MANYLPLSFNIENRPILIFGGGSKAYEKIDKLMPYGPSLTVAAEKVTPAIKQLGKEKQIALVRSNGSNAGTLIARLKPIFVIIADVDAETIASIFKTCRKNNTEVHTVDQKDFCTFHFPSVIQKKNLSIAVSASGASADAAKWVIEHIERTLPAAIDSTLEHFAAFRQKLAEKASGLKSGKFATIYRDFLDTALRENRVLSAGEMAQLMAKHMEES
jgi:siroheme synthase-like protein